MFGLLEKEFEKIYGEKVDIVSSLDHPYVSPPTRILDSHHILNGLSEEGNKVVVLNWDVSNPGDRTYRYDLLVDSGVIGKTSDLFLYELDIPYALQKAKPIDTSLYRSYFSAALDHFVVDHLLIDDVQRGFQERFGRILQMYQNARATSDAEAFLFTKEILKGIYSLWGFGDLADFIEDKYVGYLGSKFVSSWIPYCIEKELGGVDLFYLAGLDVFTRRLFRGIDEGVDDRLLQDISYQTVHRGELADAVRKGEIIPSIEVFYWSLVLAGIKHFGNDYGCLGRLQEHFSEGESLQFTGKNDDGRSFLVFDKDYSIQLVASGGKFLKVKKVGSKATRINSMVAAFVFLGDQVKDVYKKGKDRSIRVADKVISLQ